MDENGNVDPIIVSRIAQNRYHWICRNFAKRIQAITLKSQPLLAWNFLYFGL
jgi:hypothetical protein